MCRVRASSVGFRSLFCPLVGGKKLQNLYPKLGWKINKDMLLLLCSLFKSLWQHPIKVHIFSSLAVWHRPQTKRNDSAKQTAARGIFPTEHKWCVFSGWQPAGWSPVAQNPHLLGKKQQSCRGHDPNHPVGECVSINEGRNGNFFTFLGKQVLWFMNTWQAIDAIKVLGLKP